MAYFLLECDLTRKEAFSINLNIKAPKGVTITDTGEGNPEYASIPTGIQ